MDIRLTLDGRPVDATLNDSPAARDFAAPLPLTLDLRDFHQTERIADLPPQAVHLRRSRKPADPRSATWPTTRPGTTSPLLPRRRLRHTPTC